MTQPTDPLDAAAVVEAVAVEFEVTPADVRVPPPTPENMQPTPVPIPGDVRLVLDLDALPAVLKSPDGAGLRMSAAVAVLWRMFHALEIRAVTGSLVLTGVPGGIGGTIWQEGRTIDFPITWDTPTPTPPTGALITTEATIQATGKTVARLKEGSATTTGGVITATNISDGDVIVNTTDPLIYHAQALYLFTPVLDLEP